MDPASTQTPADPTRFAAVVIGGSAGGLEAVGALLSRLPADFPLPILLALHLHKSDRGRFAVHLDSRIPLRAVEAEDKQATRPGWVHVAPANYHLLVERDGSLSLSIDPRVNWSRPSIDVLFESAARTWTDRLIAVILSGANDDGAEGMRLVGELGGMCLAQDPDTAQSPVMPRAAIARAGVELILAPGDLGGLLLHLATGESGQPDHATAERVPAR